MTIALLITGATGKQGGAVVDSLIAQNGDVEILAVTRNAQSGTAQKLAQKSNKIKLVQGDLDDPAGIFQNAKKVTSMPIWGVFSVQTVNMGKDGTAIEERQGKALIDEAIAQHVEYFVYTSVDRGGDASIDTPTNIPHFISKHNIEQHLFEKTKDGVMNWTVLRPTFFFDNIAPGFLGKVTITAWDMYLKGKPLQAIATSDIGYFAASAFLHEDRFRNQCISLAGEELTFETLAKKFKSKTGKSVPTTYRVFIYIIMWMSKEFSTMFQWFHDRGYGADIEQLRKLHPGLKDFDKWLEEDSTFTKQ
ncbi:hypothetical protein FE257_008562 [Aspergillus nanangensis]|uniref:NmrA-like domain-containing protein n=1 Tax=Aspergillus nanangensis TaxID=2582783 RepID=A0AAD4CLB2_ASPNN|nr:hypothetical protein FE257_008562 [Aspergillus nanangensis]